MSVEETPKPWSIATCDRCGNKIEFDPDMILPNTWGKIHITIFDGRSSQEYHDLCYRCLKSLNEWMNQP